MCVQAVHRGEVWASSEELRFVFSALPQIPLDGTIDGESTKRAVLLTKREEGLARLVAEGFTNRDISRHMNLSENTVRNYLFRIFNKLGTSNRLELALHVINQRERDRVA
jgi:two-component system nitrate/nitrite response regulator NarL